MTSRPGWMAISRWGGRVTLAFTLGFSVLGYQNCGQFEPVALELGSNGQGIADITPLVYTAPTIAATNPPSALSSGRDQILKFVVALDSRLALKTASCRLDSLPPQDCSTQTFSMTGLADGDHVVVVSAEDSSGQKTPDMRLLFRIDGTAPVITVSQMPPAISGSTVSLAWNATDALAGVTDVECSLDGATFAKCTSPMTLSSLAMGSHTIKIHAKDGAGNTSADWTSTWTVDASTPVITLSMKPTAVTNSKTATFAFSGVIGNVAVTAFQCSLDNAAFTVCTSPMSYMNLADGNHSFRIQGRDNNGQYSPPMTFAWSIDSVVPSTPILTSNVTANVKVNAASISFTSTDAASSVASYQCSLDNAAFAACTSPRSLTALAEGVHSFRVKAFDAAGNESSIGMQSWRVDMTLPVIAFTAKPLATTMETSATFAFTTTDAGSGVTKIECQLDTQAYSVCTSPKVLSALTSGLHAFRVRATDAAGNVQTLEDAWTVEMTAPPPPPVLDGRMLYTNNCANCHGPVDTSTKRGRTAVQIQNAINSVGQMSGLKTLSSGQVSAIASALNGTAPIACNTNFTPERVPVRLLSNVEYDNIATDVFKSLRRPSVDAKFELSVPGSSGFSNSFTTSEPNSTPITLMMVEKYFNAANAIADEVIANKAVLGSAYSGFASCALNVTTVTETCFDSIVRSVTLKAWRRPVSETTANNEFGRLKAILKGGGTFDTGLRDFITALLISPNFLSVAYGPTTLMAANQTFALNPYQLASRLSFFIWQSAPDDTLLAAAANGSLATATTLQAQVVRMLKDARARRFSSIMTSEWLGVDGIRNMGLTTIGAGTLNSMVSESRLLFDDIVVNDQSFLKSISANYAYLDKTMADYYGVPFGGTVATNFVKTDISNTPRRGLLGQAAFLVSTSGSQSETHPVQRGKFIAQSLGCYEIAPPPAGIDTSLSSSTYPANATPAEKLAIHTQNVSCASCHKVLDPYGLAMETFDARGLSRTTYATINRTIDSSGTLPTGESFANTNEFTQTLIASPQIRSCLVRKVMALGLARKVASIDDACSSSELSTQYMTETSKFSDLIYNIVNSRQFKLQSTEAP